MLGKLIKYDIRSTWRDFAGVYLSILLGVLIVPQLFNHFSSEVVNVLAGFIMAAIVISTIVIMIVTLFKIFNTNVFSKEGYLTMTLPVNSRQIVTSKLLVSTMWIILTGIMAVIGIFIFVLNMNAVAMPEMAAAFKEFMTMFDTSGLWAIILMAIAMIASAVKEISKLFLACSIAHLKQFGKFRVAVGILSYFILSWIETLIIQAAGFILSLMPNMAEYARQLEAMNDPNSFKQFIDLFSGVMGVGILYSMILTAVYAVSIIWILDRKLDLD